MSALLSFREKNKEVEKNKVVEKRSGMSSKGKNKDLKSSFSKKKVLAYSILYIVNLFELRYIFVCIIPLQLL